MLGGLTPIHPPPMGHASVTDKYRFVLTTIFHLDSRDDRRYRIAYDDAHGARTQRRRQVDGPPVLDRAQSVRLPALDVLVSHQLDAGEQENAQRTRPDTFEERQQSAVLVSVDHHVRDVRVIADGQTRFYGLQAGS